MERDLGCQALSSCVTLGGSHDSINQERRSRLHSASGSEAVLTCRLLWVPLQFLSLSQLGRSGETQLSRILTVSYFALREIALARFLYIFH